MPEKMGKCSYLRDKEKKNEFKLYWTGYTEGRNIQKPELPTSIKLNMHLKAFYGRILNICTKVQKESIDEESKGQLTSLDFSKWFQEEGKTGGLNPECWERTLFTRSVFSFTLWLIPAAEQGRESEKENIV